MNSWRDEDIPFYLREAERWSGAGGSVLELGAGEGRVALPMARAGFRVTALESAPDMRELLGRKLEAEEPEVRERVEVVPGDMRRVALDRLFRFVYVPFNTLLLLSQPHERQRMLEAVREHLAPSGALAFDIFTPDPRKLADQPDWQLELDFETDDPEHGRVRVRREARSRHDLGHQVKRVWFRNRVLKGERELAAWEDDLELAFMFPREVELLLERQGFRIKQRYGGPDYRAYAATPDDVQPMYIVAQLVA
jgi:SAM-dependent methyltransferase